MDNVCVKTSFTFIDLSIPESYYYIFRLFHVWCRSIIYIYSKFIAFWSYKFNICRRNTDGSDHAWPGGCTRSFSTWYVWYMFQSFIMSIQECLLFLTCNRWWYGIQWLLYFVSSSFFFLAQAKIFYLVF